MLESNPAGVDVAGHGDGSVGLGPADGSGEGLEGEPGDPQVLLDGGVGQGLDQLRLARAGQARATTRFSALPIHSRAARASWAFDDAHADAALDACSPFGKGRHPAALNFGDCCTYAGASVAGEPLLVVGDDFTKTDLPWSVSSPMSYQLTTGNLTKP